MIYLKKITQNLDNRVTHPPIIHRFPHCIKRKSINMICPESFTNINKISGVNNTALRYKFICQIICLNDMIRELQI